MAFFSPFRSCAVLSRGRAWLELLPLTHLQLQLKHSYLHSLPDYFLSLMRHMFSQLVPLPVTFTSRVIVFPARLSLFLLELNCHPPASSLQPPALLPPAVTPLWIPPSLTHQSFHQSLSRRHCESPKQHLLSRLPEPQTTAFKLMIRIPSFNRLPVLVSAFGSSSPLRTLTQRTPP